MGKKKRQKMMLQPVYSRVQRKKTLIFVPTAGTVCAQTVNNLIGLTKFSNDWFLFKATDNCLVHDARNRAVETMFQHEADGILFIDSDQTFQKDAFNRLLESHKQIIGAPIVRKTPPYYPNIGKWDDTVKEWVVYKEYPKHHLFQVDYIGMGFCYISREVFEKISKPYFDCSWIVNENFKEGEKMIGEDVYFCDKAKKAGFKVWCDPTIQVGHIGNYVYEQSIFQDYGKVLAEREKQRIEIQTKERQYDEKKETENTGRNADSEPDIPEDSPEPCQCGQGNGT